ncbi:hypothetical protein BDW02DRAFT_203718 [Decorospora gaudefroyi]|uniref:Mid2 domain-containing protein n=1 Tax=Decorospora gaudefroyi TaxID=184978 RepID=A0A6A5KFA5_9PLEO|nr:hypothetical protein BDW02DRAFT_203718 [Decorospora gaudefroyi]
MRSLPLTFAIIFFSQRTTAQVAHEDLPCFLPNGTELPNTSLYNKYQPCSNPDVRTVCCKTAPPNSVTGPDSHECLPNGVCAHRLEVDGDEYFNYYASFCIFGDYEEQGCLNVCAGSRDEDLESFMIPCNGRPDSEKWCCGQSTSCCDDPDSPDLVILPQTLGGTISPSSSTRSSSRSTRTSAYDYTSTTSASSSSSSDDDDEGLSAGALAGIVVGAVAGVALLAAAIFFALRARKYKKRADASAGASATNDSEVPPPPPGYTEAPTQIHVPQDKYAHQAPVEMPGEMVERSELRG